MTTDEISNGAVFAVMLIFAIIFIGAIVYLVSDTTPATQSVPASQSQPKQDHCFWVEDYWLGIPREVCND